MTADDVPLSDEERLVLRRIAAERGISPKRHRVKSAISVLLIALATLLALLSVVAVWVSDIVGDTDRYVATVAPLASNPDVQNGAANRITDAVAGQIDVKGIVDQLTQALHQQGVPPRATALFGGLSGPITSGLTDLIHTTSLRVVQSDAFATLWSDANRLGHASLVKAMTGQGGAAVQVNDGAITLDVAPVIDKVKAALVADGLGAAAKIPQVHTTFTIAQSGDLAKFRTLFRILQIAGNWLPVVAIAIAAAGIMLAHDRRTALIGTGVAFAAMMLVLGIALVFVRALYIDRLPPTVSPPAAGAVFDAIVRFLRSALRTAGVLAISVAIGAYLTGPSRAATTIRAVCRTGIGATRGAAMSAGLRLGAVGRFVHRHKHWIGAAVLVVAAVWFFLWNHPTPAVTAGFAIAVLAAFSLREFLDAPDSVDATAATETS